MSAVAWEDIHRAAVFASTYLPPPLNVVSRAALWLARGYLADGCTIEGCPADVQGELLADMPDGSNQLDARARIMRQKT